MSWLVTCGVGRNLLHGCGDWTNVIIPGNAQNYVIETGILSIAGIDDIGPISTTLQQIVTIVHLQK